MMEMLLSLAMLAILLGVSLPLYLSFQVQNQLTVAADTVVHSMRRAAVLSQASEGDTTWGVHVESESVTLFQGASYAARDTDYDEIYETAAFTTSGVTDVVFSQLTGYPDTTGTLTLTGATNDTQSITINAKGAVSY
jgi:Tfp pilus assembly protein FimT